MTVITKLRRHWYHKQGRFPPEDVDAVLGKNAMIEHGDGENEAEWRSRLKRQDDEAMAKADEDEDAAS